MPFTVTVAPSSPSTTVPKPIMSPYWLQPSKETVKFIIPDRVEFEVVCPSSPPASFTLSMVTSISVFDIVASTTEETVPLFRRRTEPFSKSRVFLCCPLCQIPSRRHLFCLQYAYRTLPVCGRAGYGDIRVDMADCTAVYSANSAYKKRLIGRNRYTSAYRDEGLLKFGKIACGVSLLTGARAVDRLEAKQKARESKKGSGFCAAPFWIASSQA